MQRRTATKSLVFHNGQLAFFACALVGLGVGACDRVAKKVAEKVDEAKAQKELAEATPEKSPAEPVVVKEKHGMVWVPAGEFWMGCNEEVDQWCSGVEKPGHKVWLDAYWIDRYEVSVAEYKACVDAGACAPPKVKDEGCNWGVEGRDDHPINCVFYKMAAAYCLSRGKMLPTEAQWEKAARGTDGRLFPWGNEPLAACPYANITGEKDVGCDKGITAPGGSHPKDTSPYGAVDMLGNVEEFTRDIFDPDAYEHHALKNPLITGTGERPPDYVTRGASLIEMGKEGTRLGNRFSSTDVSAGLDTGFRCVSEAAEPPAPPTSGEKVGAAVAPEPAAAPNTAEGRPGSSAETPEQARTGCDPADPHCKPAGASAGADVIGSWAETTPGGARYALRNVPVDVVDVLLRAAADRPQGARLRWAWILGEGGYAPGDQVRAPVAVSVDTGSGEIGFALIGPGKQGYGRLGALETVPSRGAKFEFRPRARDIDGDGVRDLFVRYAVYDPEDEYQQWPISGLLLFASQSRSVVDFDYGAYRMLGSSNHPLVIESVDECWQTTPDGAFLFVQNRGSVAKEEAGGHCVMAMRYDASGGSVAPVAIREATSVGRCAFDADGIPGGPKVHLEVAPAGKGGKFWPPDTDVSFCPVPSLPVP